MKLFDEIKPVFFIDNKMNNLLNDINVKLKNINVNDKQKRKYMISKSKIRSIHSSLAIEANSLSLFDVESISENKLILGKKDEVQEENKTYIRRERNYKKLERSFYVGDIEETKIKATYKDGILNVTIPKQKDNNTNKRISID